jgi:ADP-ribose pyrophosphatase
MDLKEMLLESQPAYDGKLLHVRLDTVQLPNGKTTFREVVRHPGAVVIVPIDNDGNLHLVRQFRYPCGRAVLEVPAGKLEPGEDPFAAAKRELSEETGAHAGRWIELGRLLPTPGFCDELQHLYLARDLTFGDTHPDEDEFLEQVTVPFDEAVAMAADGRLEDGKSVAAILRAAYRYKED